jgi:hypothetical protein
LLYIIFHDESLIPASIKMEDLPPELKNKKPVNPNIPYAKGENDERERDNDSSSDEEQDKKLSLEEILNPFLDKKGAIFGACLMAATLITVLALNAASSGGGHERPVFWVTLPAAFIMFCFDLTLGWLNRQETRQIAHDGRRRAEAVQAERAEERRKSIAQVDAGAIELSESPRTTDPPSEKAFTSDAATSDTHPQEGVPHTTAKEHTVREEGGKPIQHQQRTTLSSLIANSYRSAQETFPTTMTVFHHLPLALVPFAFCMFVLVQALVTKGWVPVFAYGWDHWVERTGTVGAVGGMGFVSVILCNVSFHMHQIFLDISRLTHFNSSPAQISERPFSFAASSKHGKKSTNAAVSRYLIARSGVQCIAWRSASTTALLAWRLARRLRACCGEISWGENIFVLAGWSLHA